MCLEAKDPNPQQDRGGDLQRVCRKRQFDQNYFSSAPELAVQLTNDAPARVDLPCFEDISR